MSVWRADGTVGPAFLNGDTTIRSPANPRAPHLRTPAELQGTWWPGSRDDCPSGSARGGGGGGGGGGDGGGAGRRPTQDQPGSAEQPMVEVHAEAVPWEALRLEIEREEATLQTFRNLAGAEQGEIHGMQGAIREQVAKISELKQELHTRWASYKSARRGVGGEGGGPQGASPSVHLPAERAAGGGGGGRSPPVTPPRTTEL